MSDQPGGENREPTEEEMRAYLGQMRAAPAGQILSEVLSALLNAAQVKLGRRDARLLLDLSSRMIDDAREHLDAELTKQVDDALTQLRMGQVDAEKQVAARGEVEPGDLGSEEAAAAPEPGGAASPEQQPDAHQPPPPGQQSDAASRLWVPGR